ncbi:MAG: decaprenyl-phosphate phosphoribosyltransferase [Candidatus Omnitrophica bacterium]|nr:decaprenyl-phosphate phosphoribosyltransferase [Candidatus Omnitrophota bacterium]
MIQAILLSMRPRQWVKNIVVFVPLVFGLRLLRIDLAISSILVFLTYTAMMGAVYIFNDILDYENDRLHPIKKLRPIASGQLSFRKGWAAVLILALISLFFAFCINVQLGILMIFVIIINWLYSCYLKQVVIVDVVCFSLFYIFRLLAGALVVEVALSHWVIICTGLLAMFVGFGKRRSELVLMQKKANKQRKVLSSYSVPYLDLCLVIMSSAAILTYILYTVSEQAIYYSGNKLYFTVPFVIYGVMRYLFLVIEKNKGEDPIRIFLRDKGMIGTFILWLILFGFFLYG